MRETTKTLLDSADVRMLLSEIGSELSAEGRTAEIALYGGAALTLLFDSRGNTKDVDYVALAGDTDALSGISDAVGRRHGLEPGWLNDAVSIFAAEAPDHEHFGDFPSECPGLRVFVASPRYMLAMKLMSMRSPFETSDLSDIWNLAGHCGVSTAAEAREWLRKFYPDGTIPRHKDLILEDLFEARAAGREYSPMLGWGA